VVGGVVLAGGIALGVAAPASARESPPELDVGHAMDVLAGQQVYRAPAPSPTSTSSG